MLIKNIQLIQDNSNWKYVFLLMYIFSWFILWFIPKSFYHTSGDTGIAGWLLLIMVFFIMPILLFYTLAYFGFKNNTSKGFAWLSIFLIYPFFLYIGKLAEDELQMFEQTTSGVITEAYLSSRRRRQTVWRVRAKYYVDGKIYYTSVRDDKDRTLVSGDTVTIVYSSETPEICLIKNLQDHYER